MFKISGYKDIHNFTFGGKIATIKENGKKLSLQISNSPTILIIDLNSNALDGNQDKKRNEGFYKKVSQIYSELKNTDIHIYKYLNPPPYRSSLKYFKISGFHHDTKYQDSFISLTNFDNFNSYINESKDLIYNTDSTRQTLPKQSKNNFFYEWYWAFEQIAGASEIENVDVNADYHEEMNSNAYIRNFIDNVIDKQLISKEFTNIYYLSYNKIDVSEKYKNKGDVQYLNLKNQTVEDILEIITKN